MKRVLTLLYPDGNENEQTDILPKARRIGDRNTYEALNNPPTTLVSQIRPPTNSKHVDIGYGLQLQNIPMSSTPEHTSIQNLTKQLQINLRNFTDRGQCQTIMDAWAHILVCSMQNSRQMDDI